MDEDGEQTFSTYAHARSGRLLTLAWLITRNREDAHDAVQDALTSLYRRWDRLPTGDELDAYVHKSVVHACLRVIRHRPPTLSVAAPDDLPGAPATGDPGDQVAAADEVWRLCAALSATQRSAVVLRFHQQLSFAEIAKVLGCREATARSHVHRAVGLMRERLARGGDQ